jgi:hypothetical protein
MQNKIEQRTIADIKLEPNKKLGYYLVNNSIFYNKFQAMIEGTRTNSQVRWFFNEDTLFKFPWATEPPDTIEEIYRRRAQQLRDKYDYIRVEASGGADSNNVIFSFLLNNIHLDEVVYRYPKVAERHFSTSAHDLRTENSLSEWELAAQPLLKWIATNYPATKISIVDYGESLADPDFSKNESWVFESKNYLSLAYCMGKFDNATDEFYHLADRDTKICIVYGADKPKVIIKDDKFFVYYIDNHTGHTTPSVGDYTNITNEMFYWSADMPEIVAKQAHMVKQWFEQPTNLKFADVIKWPGHTSVRVRSLYEQLVRNIIYPHYDISTFQTVKPLINITNEMDDWVFTNYKDTAVFAIWEAGIKYLEDNIDDIYFVKHPTHGNTDLQFFESPYYYLGECNIKTPQPLLHTKQVIGNNVINAKEATRACRHLINGRLVIY